MKTVLSSVVIGVLFLAPAACGTPKDLNFEDLGFGYQGAGQIPAGYKGLSWSKHSYWIGKKQLPGTGFEYGTVGRVSLFTAFGDNISLSGGVFTFRGAYVTSTWDSTEKVTVEGWYKGSRMYTKTITTHNDRAYWFDFDFTYIDTLRFLPLGRHIVIDDITLAPPKITVQIDIKPGSLQNSVNLKSKGRIPVAILSDGDFDASLVDPATVRFGPSEAQAVHSALEDVDQDGDLDMILHFDTQETGISAGDTEATLTGNLSDDNNTPIEGTDSVRIVPGPK